MDGFLAGTGCSPLRGLPNLRTGKTKRASSWDRSGGNRDSVSIGAGKTKLLGKLKGPGTITHIWFTVNSPERFYLRKLVLEIYWDDEKDPSVCCPLGDFFGVGHGVLHHFVSLPLNIITWQNNPQKHGGMNCYFPMPFRKSARIQIRNEGEEKVLNFYYYIDWEQTASAPEEVGYFHAFWRRENPCKGTPADKMDVPKIIALRNKSDKDNYLILDAEGRGHYVGTLLNVHNLNPGPPEEWFGEGDDMFVIDGEKWPPSLHGTGTEDYFGAAWGFPSGAYNGPYHGISLAGSTYNWSGKWSLYRFHLEDPVIFSKSLRVSIEHGHGNWRNDDFSSVAYWYQTEPHKVFEKLAPVKQRIPRED
jgi:hypothetical protein